MLCWEIEFDAAVNAAHQIDEHLIQHRRHLTRFLVFELDRYVTVGGSVFVCCRVCESTDRLT